MTRPLALSLFACAGGDTVGLEAAGFDVIGVDHKPSKHWCGSGELHEADLSTADAVEAVIRAFAPDFVSSSPPCQANSLSTPARSRASHANLIASTRDGILRTGVPAWIENVPPMPNVRWPEIVRPDVVLCGSMFPETQRLKRHRHFELLGWFVFTPPHVGCTFAPLSLHDGSPGTNTRKAREKRNVESAHEGSNARKARVRRELVTVSGDSSYGTTPGGAAGARRKIADGADHDHVYCKNETGPECVRWREALGWIDGPKDRYSLAQCVPPSYAEFLGRALIRT